jgi:uncharacterized protein YqfA (UPF0365 family)
MFVVLVFLALFSGAVSFIVFWPYGIIFSVVSAPIVASLMTLVGAFLIKPAPYQSRVLSNKALRETDPGADVKLNENLSAD